MDSFAGRRYRWRDSLTLQSRRGEPYSPKCAASPLALLGTPATQCPWSAAAYSGPVLVTQLPQSHPHRSRGRSSLLKPRLASPRRRSSVSKKPAGCRRKPRPFPSSSSSLRLPSPGLGGSAPQPRAALLFNPGPGLRSATRAPITPPNHSTSLSSPHGHYPLRLYHLYGCTVRRSALHHTSARSLRRCR
jgi:hypothetical protein